MEVALRCLKKFLQMSSSYTIVIIMYFSFCFQEMGQFIHTIFKKYRNALFLIKFKSLLND